MRPSAPWRWETLGTFPPRSGYCFSFSWARSMLRDTTSNLGTSTHHYILAATSSTLWTTSTRIMPRLYASVLLDRTPRVGPFEGNTPVPESPRPYTGLVYQTSTSFPPVGGFSESRDRGHQDLVEEMEEHTMAWFQTLPEHVQRAYRHKDSVTQIPVLIHLLRSIQYPQTELIYRELSEGLIGKLTPGVNWHARQDQKSSTPHRYTSSTKRTGAMSPTSSKRTRSTSTGK